MAASPTDYLTKVGSPGTATSLAAPGHTIAGTSITVGSTANWPTDTAVIFAMDTVTLVNGVEVRDVGSYTEWEGVVGSATTVTGMVLRTGTDRNYPAGATTRVYVPVTSARINRLVDALLVTLNQDGTKRTGVALPAPILSGTATGTYTLGGTPTIAAPTITGAITGNALTASGANDITLTAGTSKVVKTSSVRQDNTTNTYKQGNVVTVYGRAAIQGNGAAFTGTVTVTVPVTFVQPPIVNATILGTTNATTTPTSATPAGSAGVESTITSATTFTLRVYKYAVTGFDAGVNTVAAGNYYHVHWSATGEI